MMNLKANRFFYQRETLRINCGVYFHAQSDPTIPQPSAETRTDQGQLQQQFPHTATWPCFSVTRSAGDAERSSCEVSAHQLAEIKGWTIWSSRSSYRFFDTSPCVDLLRQQPSGGALDQAALAAWKRPSRAHPELARLRAVQMIGLNNGAADGCISR